jgi:hypothetical protein
MRKNTTNNHTRFPIPDCKTVTLFAVTVERNHFTQASISSCRAIVTHSHQAGVAFLYFIFMDEDLELLIRTSPS